MSEKPLARTNITENSNLLYVQPHPIANPRTTMTANDVSRMVRKSVREGEPVKGKTLLIKAKAASNTYHSSEK